MATLSDELKVELAKVWLVGFLDHMAGTPVENEDEIRTEDGARLIVLALGCVTDVGELIAAIHQADPARAHRVVYESATQVADYIIQLDGPEINLN